MIDHIYISLEKEDINKQSWTNHSQLLRLKRGRIQNQSPLFLSGWITEPFYLFLLTVSFFWPFYSYHLDTVNVTIKWAGARWEPMTKRELKSSGLELWQDWKGIWGAVKAMFRQVCTDYTGARSDGWTCFCPLPSPSLKLCASLSTDSAWTVGSLAGFHAPVSWPASDLPSGSKKEDKLFVSSVLHERGLC